MFQFRFLLLADIFSDLLFTSHRRCMIISISGVIVTIWLIEFPNNQSITGLINTHKPTIHIIITLNNQYGTRDYHKGKIIHLHMPQQKVKFPPAKIIFGYPNNYLSWFLSYLYKKTLNKGIIHLQFVLNCHIHLY